MEDKKPFRIRKIFVTGNKRTKEDVLRHCLAPITSANSWHDVVRQLQVARLELQRLQRAGVFKSAQLLLDDAPEEGPPEPNACDLRVELIEPRWPISLDVKTTTNVALQPEMEGNVHLHNLFGRAEALSLHVHAGTDLSQTGHWTPGVKLSFNKPLLSSGPTKHLSLEAYKGSQWQQYSSLCESTASTTFSYLHGNHQVAYELGWREVTPFAAAPAETRLLAGQSLKSSVKHVWSMDRTDNSIVPTAGYALETSHELAGFGGDVRFIKQQLSAQWHVGLPFIRDSAFSCTAKAGHLLPLFGDSSRSVDRFYLGGATSLRGFQYNTVGPNQKGSSLGGNLFGSASAHFTMPLPVKDVDFVKLHAFAQAGNLTTYNTTTDVVGNIKHFVETGRAVLGAGLVFATPLGRVEFNLCYPLKKQPGDCTDFWQLGVGMKFA